MKMKYYKTGDKMQNSRMIFNADDYGVNYNQSIRILQCAKRGKLNGISILPNGNELEKCMKLIPHEIKKAIHINLVEGYCCGDKSSLSLLVNKNGKFKHGFVGLWLLSLCRPFKMRRQLKLECKAQMDRVMEYMGDNYRLRIDSHMHCHMIPAIFDVLGDLCTNSGTDIEYIRWPVEPVCLYLKNISACKKIKLTNLMKVLVINVFSLQDRKYLKRYRLVDKISCFWGVMFSGEMTIENVQLMKGSFERYIKHRNYNLEILFHPGGIKAGEYFLDESAKGFVAFYTSGNRYKERKTLCNI